MEPVALYQTKWPYPKRRFELGEDSIRVTGSRNHIDFDITLPIARLDTAFERLWIYRGSFWIGYGWIMFVTMLLLAFFCYVASQGYRGDFLWMLVALIACEGAGLCFILMNRHKTEFIQFRSDAGIAVIGIPNDTRQSEEFNQFVETFIGQIERVREKGSSLRG